MNASYSWSLIPVLDCWEAYTPFLGTSPLCRLKKSSSTWHHYFDFLASFLDPKKWFRSCVDPSKKGTRLTGYFPVICGYGGNPKSISNFKSTIELPYQYMRNQSRIPIIWISWLWLYIPHYNVHPFRMFEMRTKPSLIKKRSHGWIILCTWCPRRRYFKPQWRSNKKT